MTDTLPDLDALLTATIPGDPQSQGSKRVVPTAAGYRPIESNRRLAPWRVDAITHLQVAMPPGWQPLDGPVSVTVEFVFARPSSHYGTGRNAGRLKPSAPVWKTTAPDLDKLERALFDALTQSGAVRDDARIVTGHRSKLWGPRSETRVTIGRP